MEALPLFLFYPMLNITVDPPYGLGDKLVTGGTWAKKWQSNGADGWQSQNPAWCMEWGKRKPPKDFTKCLWERPKTNQL